MLSSKTNIRFAMASNRWLGRNTEGRSSKRLIFPAVQSQHLELPNLVCQPAIDLSCAQSLRFLQLAEPFLSNSGIGLNLSVNSDEILWMKNQTVDEESKKNTVIQTSMLTTGFHLQSGEKNFKHLQALIHNQFSFYVKWRSKRPIALRAIIHHFNTYPNLSRLFQFPALMKITYLQFKNVKYFTITMWLHSGSPAC